MIQINLFSHLDNSQKDFFNSFLYFPFFWINFGFSSSWYVYTGNELGALLGEYMMTAYPVSPQKKRYVLASTVSSKMLARIATKNGSYFDETLGGFKWLGNRAIEIENAGNVALFAFEEAIGQLWLKNFFFICQYIYILYGIKLLINFLLFSTFFFLLFFDFKFTLSLGFMCGSIIKDKDGVSALAVFAEMAVQLKKRGMTVYQHLEDLYKQWVIQ